MTGLDIITTACNLTYNFVEDRIKIATFMHYFDS